MIQVLTDTPKGRTRVVLTDCHHAPDMHNIISRMAAAGSNVVAVTDFFAVLVNGDAQHVVVYTPDHRLVEQDRACWESSR